MGRKKLCVAYIAEYFSLCSVEYSHPILDCCSYVLPLVEHKGERNWKYHTAGWVGCSDVGVLAPPPNCPSDKARP